SFGPRVPTWGQTRSCLNGSLKLRGFCLKIHMLPRLRRKPLFFGLTLVPVVLLTGVWMTLGRLDLQGREFFETGRGAIDFLDRLARTLRDGDLAAAERFYSPDYQGSSLGLGNLRRVGEKDGVTTSGFAARPGAFDR